MGALPQEDIEPEMIAEEAAVAVLIVAAGAGARMGELPASRVPSAPWLPTKAFALIGSARQPVAWHTAQAFRDLPNRRECVVVVPADTSPEACAALAAALDEVGVDHVVPGGETRGDSIVNGLRSLTSDAGLVLVHDAVRPFIAPSTIATACALACEQGAAVVGLPMTDTVKRIDASASPPTILDTVDRDSLWRVQTPQVFQRRLLQRSYTHWLTAGRPPVTDDAQVVALAHADAAIPLLAGSPFNVKLTTPTDFPLADWLVDHPEVWRGEEA